MHIPMTPVISSPEWNAAGFNVSSNTCAFPAQKEYKRSFKTSCFDESYCNPHFSMCVVDVSKCHLLFLILLLRVPNENTGIGRFRKSNTERRRNTFVFTLGLKEERTNVNKIKGL